MTKYIQLEFPEAQYFMQGGLYPSDNLFFDPDKNVWFIPEDEYRQVCPDDANTVSGSEGKDLIKITNVKGSVCQAELNATTTHEKEMVGASLVSIMMKDDEFGKLMVQYVSLYLSRRTEMEAANREAIRRGKIKTKN